MFDFHRVLTLLCLAVLLQRCADFEPPPDEQVEASQAVIAPALAVGLTPSAPAVSPAGAFTYSVPIWTPPGVGVAEPHLTLEYGSDKGASPFGTGWSLSGLSSIRRCPKTVASEGQGGPVEMTPGDRYCLNGMKLKVVSGAPGALGTIYATELETFARIEVTALAAGSGPLRFQVTKKAGLVETYEPVVAGVGPFHTWVLTRVEDRFGNRMVYRYDAGRYPAGRGGAPMVRSIEYPITAVNAAPLYRVVFNSEARPDELNRFTAGEPDSVGERFTQLQVTDAASGVVIKSYNFTYRQGAVSGRSLLSAIQECGRTTCREPIVITTEANNRTGFGTSPWQNLAMAPLAPYTGIVSRCGGVLPVDVNGDGRTDLLYAREIANVYELGCRWYLRLSVNRELEPIERPLPWRTNPFRPNVFTGNFLANEREQIVLPIPNQGNGLNDEYYVLDFDAATAQFTAQALGIPENNVPTDPDIMVKAADLDGDGRRDLIFASLGMGARISARLNQTVTGGFPAFGPLTTIYTFPSSWRTAYDFRPKGIGIVRNVGSIVEADFNGDGLRDLGVSVHGPDNALSTTSPVLIGFQPLLSRGANGAVPAPLVPFAAMNVLTTTDAAIDSASYATVFDLNGDSCSDFEMGTTVWVSNCRNGWSRTWTSATEIVTGSALVDDLNQDDQSDLIVGNRFLRSLGTSLAAPSTVEVPAPAGCGNPFLIDPRGDGRSQLGFVCGGALQLFLPHGGRADLVTEVKKGLGSYARPTYVTVSASGGIYRRSGSRVSYPYREVQLNFPIVSSLTVMEGDGAVPFTKDYTYTSAVTHLAGRGFQGFNEISIADNRQPNLLSIDTYSVAFPTTGTKTWNHTIERTKGFFVGDSTSNTFVTRTLGVGAEQRYFPYVALERSSASEAVIGTDGTLGSPRVILSRTKALTPDDYGNAERVVTTTLDESRTPGQSWTTDETTLFVNDPTTGCFGAPYSTTTVSIAPFMPRLTRTSTSTVDRAKCRVTSTTSEPASPELKTWVGVSFDACGNVTTSSVVGSNPDGTAMPARVTTTSYGTRCQFPESETNPEGETTAWKYDPGFGVPTELRDANGLTTTWTIDEFGRVIFERRPDATEHHTTYAQCAARGCWPGLDGDTHSARFDVVISSNGTLASSTAEYFNGAGQKVEERSDHANGQFLADRHYMYDPFGRVQAVAMNDSYFETEYDLFGRVTSSRGYRIDPVTFETTHEQRTRFAYAGTKTMRTDPRGNVHTEDRDVMGQLRVVTEPSPGGTTTYDYDAHGRLVRMVGPTGAVSTSTFNLLGAQLSTTSADTGLQRSTVNSLGEVLSHTNARGQVTTSTYDRLGRRRTRVEPEGTTMWTYGADPLAKNVGKLRFLVTDTYRETYFYDSLGRLNNWNVGWGTADAQRFDLTYNSLGFVDTVSYPQMVRTTPALNERIVLKYGYDMGRLTKAWDVTGGVARTLWSLDRLTPFDAPLQETFPGVSPVVVRSTYRPVTNALETRRAELGGTTRLALDLGWDAAGNLSSRRDVLRNLTETFTHDALDRLSVASLNGTPWLNVFYDAAGNITSKSAVGLYTYADPAHRHAVTSAGGNTLTYDADGNMASKNGSPMTWTSFNAPKVVRAGALSSTFGYDPDREPYVTTSVYPGGLVETIRRVGGFERIDADGTVRWRVRLTTPSGTQLVREDSGEVKVLVSDHLGSALTVLSPTNGAVLADENFDPFGARRSPSDWWNVGPPPPWALHERTGFGGHDQLDNVGFVHLGGRVYDPTIGRFLSADPVRHLDRPQTLNRYAFVENRPLSMVDPTGFEDKLPDFTQVTPSVPGVHIEPPIQTGDRVVVVGHILWRWSNDTSTGGPGELSRAILGYDSNSFAFAGSVWTGPAMSAAPALRPDNTLANLGLAFTGLPGFAYAGHTLVEDVREDPYTAVGMMAAGGVAGLALRGLGLGLNAARATSATMTAVKLTKQATKQTKRLTNVEPFSSEQRALMDIAKDYNRAGVISRADAEAYLELAKDTRLASRSKVAIHEGGTQGWRAPHLHAGNGTGQHSLYIVEDPAGFSTTFPNGRTMNEVFAPFRR